MSRTEDDARRIHKAEEAQARMLAALPEFPQYGYYVKTGLAGYGPELDESDMPAPTWESVANYIYSELGYAADSAMENAYTAGDTEGDYERAWKEFKRSENLGALAAELDNKRAKAPLYAGRTKLWHATIYSIINARFPLDISDNTRLYVWECEENPDSEEA